MYEVWASTGHGTHVEARFRLLADAVRHVRDHAGEASFAIRQPDGTWYKRRSDGKSIFPSEPPPPGGTN